jgi:hypothetical protein
MRYTNSKNPLPFPRNFHAQAFGVAPDLFHTDQQAFFLFGEKSSPEGHRQTTNFDFQYNPETNMVDMAVSQIDHDAIEPHAVVKISGMDTENLDNLIQRLVIIRNHQTRVHFERNGSFDSRYGLYWKLVKQD